MAQRVFDPIGYTCPVTLLPKLVLQRLWDLKLNWDSPVPDEVNQEFVQQREDLKYFYLIYLDTSDSTSRKNRKDHYMYFVMPLVRTKDIDVDDTSTGAFDNLSSEVDCHFWSDLTKFRVVNICK